VRIVETPTDRATPSTDPSVIADVVDDATTVLLIGPTGDERVNAAGLSFLSSPSPAKNHVHWVTMLRSPESIARTWSNNVADAPASLAFVEVGESRYSPGVDTEAVHDTAGISYSITCVESPTDLTALGVTLSEQLSSSTTDGQHRLLFESLSTLLQYVPQSVVFRLVHTLHWQFTGTDVTVCYHLDPSIHATQTIHTFLSVCDALVTADGDDEGFVAVRR
jgi:hypothetical protein